MQGNKVASHHGATDEESIEEDVPVHKVELAVGHGFDDMHCRCGSGFTDNVSHRRKLQCKKDGTTQWSGDSEHTIDEASQTATDKLCLPSLWQAQLSFDFHYRNSSLKFEIKAKQFYAASQRVL